MKRIVFSFAFSLLAFGGVEKEYLKITKVKPAAVLQNGKAGEAVITATVEKDMHVQSNPSSKPNLVPTQLTIEGNESFEVGVVQYPEGKPFRLESSDSEILTYEGSFDIKVPLKALHGKAKLGKNEINAKLRYQACNNKTCFFPTNVKFTIPVMVYK